MQSFTVEAREREKREKKARGSLPAAIDCRSIINELPPLKWNDIIDTLSGSARIIQGF